MQKPRRKKNTSHLPLLAALSVSAFAAGAVFAAKDHIWGNPLAYAPGEITGSTAAAPQGVGASGLPLPRFVTLKANKVNVRKGPSNDHQVAFVFQMKGLPVEITAEFENWRKIRDAEGAEGWILQSMLTGRRTAYVATWNKDATVPLFAAKNAGSGLTARLELGVLAAIDTCDGQWCALTVDGHQGYADQSLLWGVYPGEVVD